MESNSPLDNLPPTLSKPLEDVANEKTDSTGRNEPEETDQPDVAVSPPSDGEASSDDLGPEDYVRSPKKETKAPSTGVDPSPKAPSTSVDPSPKASSTSVDPSPKAPSTGADPSPKNRSPKPKSSPQSEYRICPHCREWPITGPYEFCSEKCEREAGIAKRKAVFRVLKPLEQKDRVAQAIYQKFVTEWEDPTGELGVPQVRAMYQISLPYYEDRFLDAIAKAQAHGGSNTKSAWFACQCICDVGVKSADLCNFRSCGICMVVKSGFDELAFGEPTNNGIYGDGIYANLNPAMAHRFTVRKSDHDSRVVILCSIVELEPGAPVENILDYSAAIDGSGRVFCARKDVIIPRRLIVYSIKPPAQQGPPTNMDVD